MFPKPTVVAGEPVLGLDIETFRTCGDTVSVDCADRCQLSIPKAGVRLVIVSNGYETKIFDLWDKGVTETIRAEILRQPETRFIAHNGTAFDWPILSRVLGIDKPLTADTMILEKVVKLGDIKEHSRNGGFSLAQTMENRLGINLKQEVDHRIWNKPTLPESALIYAVADARSLVQIYRMQASEITDTALRIENEVQRSISSMVSTGIGVDFNRLDAKLKEVEKESRDAFDDLDALLTKAGYVGVSEMERINLKVDADTVQNVYSILEIGAPKTESGELSTESKAHKRVMMKYLRGSEAVRTGTKKWRVQHGLTALYTANKYAETMQRIGTFESAAESNRVYGQLYSVGANTGRMTSNNPNIQNIPGLLRDKRNPDACPFIAPPDMRFVSIDLSQIELRVAAAFAKDYALMEACLAEDFYSEIARRVFNRADATDKQMADSGLRQIAKTLILGMQYGSGAYTVWKSILQDKYTAITDFVPLKTVREQMQKVADAFPRWYANIRNTLEDSVYYTRPYSQAIAGGVYSRMHYPVKDYTGHSHVKGTTILNTQIQGSSALLMKLCIIESDKAGLREYMVNTVHDEVVYCFPAESAEEHTATALDSFKVAAVRFGEMVRPNLKLPDNVGWDKYIAAEASPPSKAWLKY